MPRRTVRRESSVGLVVTLIFFILTSIGLGVATYYGFTQQDQLTKDKAAAESLMKDAQAKTEWYQFQALLFRTWLGLTDGMNAPSDDASQTYDQLLAVLYGKYADGRLGKDTKGGYPADKQVLAGLIDAEGKKQFKIKTEDKTKTVVIQAVTMGWNDKTMRPNISYEDAFKGVQALADYYQQQATEAKKAQEVAEAAQKKSDEQKKADEVEFDKNVKALTAENKTGLEKAFQDLDDSINKKLDEAKALATSRQTEKEDAVKKEHTTVLDLQQKIKDMQGRLNDLNDQLAKEEQKTVETPSQGKPIPTDWKIVRMDRSGKEPFINLGSAQNVRPGLTFSIHGQGPDGQPMPASKGTLEVLNVVSDNLSQAQVVSVKDSFKDPILPGDYLYNPIFHPGGEQHVVIAGPIHMHGTKGDDLEEFERLLQRQNVVVDGYVDPQDGSIKGRLTVATDYLVLGDVGSVKEGAPDLDSIKKLQDQARSNGVRIVSAREFLDLMGYRTP